MLLFFFPKEELESLDSSIIPSRQLKDKLLRKQTRLMQMQRKEEEERLPKGIKGHRTVQMAPGFKRVKPTTISSLAN